MLSAVMSANVDLVRSIYDSWNRGDYSSAAWADPEIRVVVRRLDWTWQRK